MGGGLIGYLKILSKHRGLVDTSWWYQVGIWKYWKDLLPGSQEIFTLGRYQVSTKDTGWDLSPQWETLSLFLQGTGDICIAGEKWGHWWTLGEYWKSLGLYSYPGQDGTSPAVSQCPH